MTLSEENYLKAIYHLSKETSAEVSTNSIAQELQTKASSVTDMIQRLAEKKWVIYKKYQGVSLSDEGLKIALKIVRKHRLWEVFLVEKLNFAWDEVHEIAEQLEHIASDKLIDALDAFLKFPSTDPHGDPIPDKDGNIVVNKKCLLSELAEHQAGYCIGVKNTSSDFLKYLDKIQIAIGNHIEVLSVEPFDGSYSIDIQGRRLNISAQVAQNIYIAVEHS